MDPVGWETAFGKPGSNSVSGSQGSIPAETEPEIIVVSSIVARPLDSCGVPSALSTSVSPVGSTVWIGNNRYWLEQAVRAAAISLFGRTTVE